MLDLIAHTSLKTPTAVASFLIEELAVELGELVQRQRQLLLRLQTLSMERTAWLHSVASRLPLLAQGRLDRERRRLIQLPSQLTLSARSYLDQSRHQLRFTTRQLPLLTSYLVRHYRQELAKSLAPLPLSVERLRERLGATLERQEQAIRLAHPDEVLRRGFSLVSVGGRIITRREQLSSGVDLSIRFADGAIEAVTKE